jgi:hypothetical protein
VVEVELGKRLVEGAVEAPVEASDAVDDALHLEVDHRQDVADRVEEAIDVVALLCLGSSHGHILM